MSLEKPVETAMLVSVTGVKCLMANQWHCTLAENANRLKVSMKGEPSRLRKKDFQLEYLFSPTPNLTHSGMSV